MIKNRVLILGGNGFIGRNLCEHFLAKGWAVTSFDLLSPQKKIDGIRYIEGDFFDDRQLGAAINDQDVIIHSISTVTPGNSNVKFMQGYEKDLVQTAKLCELLVGTNTKMIFLSSGGTVYGDQPIQPITECSRTTPINHYGCIKICIENIIRTFNIQFKTKFIIARVANPYGPGQDYKKGVGFVDAAVKKAMVGDEIEVWGDGETVRDYIHIDDVCRMIYALIRYRGTEDTFNISSGEGVSQNTILSLLKEIGYDVNVTYKNARGVDVKRIVLDNSRIREVYTEPMVSFREGIARYCDYLKQYTTD